MAYRQTVEDLLGLEAQLKGVVRRQTALYRKLRAQVDHPTEEK
jgi:hypothetical protein